MSKLSTEILKEKRNELRARAICVVIPTYNNCTTIASVVKGSLLYCDDIIVVNDGCTDNTADILDTFDNITVINNTVNRGKGYALKRAFQKAQELGFAYAITIDADGQHYPAEILNFLEANKKYPGALIVGNRNLTGVERSKGSSFANKFSNFWFCVQTLHKLDDTQTGYRLYPLKKLWGLSLLTSRYEAELELLVFASWHGVKIASIPIDVYYPPRDERVSHFRPALDFTRISILNTILCFLAVVYGLPLKIARGCMKLLRTAYSLLFFIIFSLLIFTPLVWIYIKICKSAKAKSNKLHSLIYHAARFVMLKHGIPGIKFSYKIHGNPDFEKPAVIICNHQSHLDLMCQLIFTPKIIFLTNDWVWKNPFYGTIIRNAEYYPVSSGLEDLMPHLRSLADRGYSIAVYPEGTRSKTCKIGRFHQGAFYIASQLNLDILPMCLYGPGKVLPKENYMINKGQIHVNVGERITQEEIKSYGTLQQQAIMMRAKYKKIYNELCNKIEQDA